MAQAKIGQHIGIWDETVSLKEAQRRRLHGTAEVQGATFNRVWKIRNNHFADVAAGGAIQDQAECTFRVVLANEDNSTLEKRASQFTTVEQQLAF